VRTIEVILAPEQRGRLIEPCRLQRAEIFRQAVDFLMNVWVDQVENRPWCKLMLLLPAAYKKIRNEI